MWIWRYVLATTSACPYVMHGSGKPNLSMEILKYGERNLGETTHLVTSNYRKNHLVFTHKDEAKNNNSEGVISTTLEVQLSQINNTLLTH